MSANRKSLWCVVVVAAGVLPQFGFAQSFDCAKASTGIEKAICKDPKLATLDLQLAQAFKEAVAKAPEQKDQLLADQRSWIKARNADCSSSPGDCLPRAYAWRINDLKSGGALLREGVAICQKIADRYQPFASSNRGFYPTAIFNKNKNLGVIGIDNKDITEGKKLYGVELRAATVNWAAQQNPPFKFVDGLLEDLVAVNGNIWEPYVARLPESNLYLLSQEAGTEHCISTGFFAVKNGIATSTDDPLNNSDACHEDASFGMVDNQPVLFKQGYVEGSDESTYMRVARYKNGIWDTACTATFTQHGATITPWSGGWGDY